MPQRRRSGAAVRESARGKLRCRLVCLEYAAAQRLPAALSVAVAVVVVVLLAALLANLLADLAVNRLRASERHTTRHAHRLLAVAGLTIPTLGLSIPTLRRISTLGRVAGLRVARRLPVRLAAAKAALAEAKVDDLQARVDACV